MQLIPIKKLFSNQDSIRKAREVFFIHWKGGTIDTDSLRTHPRRNILFSFIILFDYFFLFVLLWKLVLRVCGIQEKMRQEKMRWENISLCPMIIFFNLFLSSRHAVKNIFSFSGSSYGHRFSGKRRNCEDFSRRRIIEWNRKSKFKVLIEFNFSVCFVIQSAMSAREKLFHFLKRKGTESSEESSSIKEQRLQERESEGETFSFRAHELSLYDFHAIYNTEP